MAKHSTVPNKGKEEKVEAKPDLLNIVLENKSDDDNISDASMASF